MKKFYYLVASMAFVLVVIMACEKSAIGVDETLTVKDDVLLSKSENAPEKEKVAICHWDADEGVYYSISVAPEAVAKHMSNHMTDYGTHIEKDKYAYSPEGTYIINRANGAVLNIMIDAYGAITGDGFTGGGSPAAQTYSGTVIVNQDYSIFMSIDQEPHGSTHEINGFVSECDGIYDLSDNKNKSEYTLFIP